MKHLRKAEQKCSETAVYRYFIGALLVLLDGLWRKITDYEKTVVFFKYAV